MLLTTMDVTLAGDRTFHASPHPIADAPATMTGRGLHYTAAGYADVWQWKATSGGSTGWMDDAHFGPPLDADADAGAQRRSLQGRLRARPGNARITSDNFIIDADEAGGAPADRATPACPRISRPHRGDGRYRPRSQSWRERRRALVHDRGRIRSRIPPRADARIPTGTVIPGVIIAGEFSGDRADVRCAARWASGHWALEVARRLDTNSQYDVPIKTGVFMRVAAFDHSQIRHTRHVRPIRLEVE